MDMNTEKAALRANFYLHIGTLTGHLKKIQDRTRTRETILRMSTDDGKDIEAALALIKMLVDNQKALDKAE